MVITAKIRKKLLTLFDGVSYRQIVSERLECHPNTVSNVLLYGQENTSVATALLELGKELKEKKQKDSNHAEAIAEQL